jgi:hypothetical protein
MQNQYQKSTQNCDSDRHNNYETNIQKLNKQSMDYNSLFSNENGKNSQSYTSKFPIEGSALRHLRNEKKNEKENMSKNVLPNYVNDYSYDDGKKNIYHDNYDTSKKVENKNFKSKMPTLSSSSVYDRQEYLSEMRQMREFMTL